MPLAVQAQDSSQYQSPFPGQPAPPQPVGAHVDAVPLGLGAAELTLNGPWKFHTGDDSGWAGPAFADDQWEKIDLAAPPGAHDDDVGLGGYVPGWGARGHPGYAGYAWYRMRVTLPAQPGLTLWLNGPAALDSAYQVFFNGHLLGGIGDFSSNPPTVTSIQPRLFAIPNSLWQQNDASEATGIIAIRVWMGPGLAASNPLLGGIHIAPAMGDAAGAKARFRLQWLQTVEGYLADLVEPLLFLGLALLALPLASGASFYRWLIAALLLTAAARLNQVIYFWLQVESDTQFFILRTVLQDPLSIAAWIMAWRARLVPRLPRWLPYAVLAVMLAAMLAQALGLPQLAALAPRAIGAYAMLAARLLLALLYLAVIAAGRYDRDWWRALPAALLIGIGLFAPELSLARLPGVWFIFGVGVSRTQFAYLAFDAALFLLLAVDIRFFVRAFHRRARLSAVPTENP